MSRLNLGAITAYAIAKKHGFEGTEEEWLESLKGKDGEGGTSPSNCYTKADGVSIEYLGISVRDPESSSNAESVVKPWVVGVGWESDNISASSSLGSDAVCFYSYDYEKETSRCTGYGLEGIEVTDDYGTTHYLSLPKEDGTLALKEELDAKLDKPTTKGMMYFNTTTGLVTTYTTYQSDPAGNQIPVANKNGCIKTNEPQDAKDCANKDYVDSGLDNKVDIPDTTVYGNYVIPYVVSTNGVRGEIGEPIPIKTGVDRGIALRGANGVLEVGTPTIGTHAATKDYVDTEIAKVVINGGGVTREELDKKVDKFDGSKETGDLRYTVYAQALGEQINKPFSRNPKEGALASYDSGGNLNVATPRSAAHATTKEYVDNAIANAGGSLYEHLVIICGRNANANNPELTFAQFNIRMFRRSATAPTLQELVNYFTQTEPTVMSWVNGWYDNGTSMTMNLANKIYSSDLGDGTMALKAQFDNGEILSVPLTESYITDIGTKLLQII